MNERRILLVATGGISLYKSVYLVRLLVRGGARVRVVMTRAATRFVTPLTFETLSSNPVRVELFDQRDTPEIPHIDLAGWAERIIVAPATADFMAKMSAGIADDLASSVVCAAGCPVLVAPAMNEGMWLNPATQRNIKTLREDNRVIIEPGSGDLACGETGRGRMMEPEDIKRRIASSFEGGGRLEGVRVLITAGRTEEEIDSVRYISNRSSGKMGFAIAKQAVNMGAEVSLIHGQADFPPPRTDAVTRVKTAAEMKDAVLKLFGGCDVLIMAAAVSDYTPCDPKDKKIKRDKEKLSIELKKTDDILALAGKRKSENQRVIGFALESSGGERKAMRKLKDKNCDFIVLNMIGEKSGFSVPTNKITLFDKSGKLLSTPVVSKEEAAGIILKELLTPERKKKG
ncbi:MAG: bifunctional phosphopantothenoylcysteine decarboxylase/phosphopantothenate--cysteine ligase CoaBC [Candidatus Krumholzibacteriota bacterium]|nr:bifunctional phosphopantothenoylcysteine decarboxylase/phosphopantothenate--cysteine ligase CoaBC [Candidatus Krumholzibacteriota bacterium]